MDRLIAEKDEVEAFARELTDEKWADVFADTFPSARWPEHRGGPPFYGYRGMRAALLRYLDGVWAGLDEDDRIFLEAVHVHGCGPSTESEMACAEILITIGLVVDEDEESDDAMSCTPRGRAVLKRAPTRAAE